MHGWHIGASCSLLIARLYGLIGSKVNPSSDYEPSNILSSLLTVCFSDVRHWRVAKKGFHGVERPNDIIGAEVETSMILLGLPPLGGIFMLVGFLAIVLMKI